MLNSTKTWQEELNKDAYFDEKIGEMVLEIKYITKIVADIRKRDMEALIEYLKESDSNNIYSLIKDYYEN